MQIAPHLQKNALFERVVHTDTKTVKDFTAQIETRDDRHTPKEATHGTHILDIFQNAFDRQRHSDFHGSHARCQSDGQPKEPLVSEKVGRDALDGIVFYFLIFAHR